MSIVYTQASDLIARLNLDLKGYGITNRIPDAFYC